MTYGRMRREIKLRALCVLLSLLFGWISTPASLTIGNWSGCQMVCCPEHHDGEAAECCFLKHRGDQPGRASTEIFRVNDQCPVTCCTPPSSAHLFPRGLNREGTHVFGLSDLSHLPDEERVNIHQSPWLTPASPRAPPSLFA